MSTTTSSNNIKTVSEEIKTVAFNKVAQVRIYNLHLMAQVIDLAMKRGAFVASEASQIGALYDTLIVGINKSFELAEEDIKKSEEIKLPTIHE